MFEFARIFRYWVFAVVLIGLLELSAQVLTVELGNEKFNLEVAEDWQDIVKGLMNREILPENSGMLFLFSDYRPHCFWMKNTKIPLDVAFINRQGVVIAVHSMPVESPRRPEETEDQYEERLPVYPSNGPAAAAIEVPMGTFARLGIAPGTTILLP